MKAWPYVSLFSLEYLIKAMMKAAHATCSLFTHFHGITWTCLSVCGQVRYSDDVVKLYFLYACTYLGDLLVNSTCLFKFPIIRILGAPAVCSRCVHNGACYEGHEAALISYMKVKAESKTCKKCKYTRKR